MCRDEVTAIGTFLGEPANVDSWLSGTTYTMPLAVIASCHFVIIGREVGQKSAAKCFDDLMRSGELHQLESRSNYAKATIRALMSAWLAGFRIVPFFGVMYGINSLLLRGFTFTLRSCFLARQLHAQACGQSSVS